MLILGCWVGAMLNEEPREMHITPKRCLMQGSPSMSRRLM